MYFASGQVLPYVGAVRCACSRSMPIASASDGTPSHLSSRL
jgi:hypothetical protein